ncbi:MAG: AMIN domain-containing protein [Limimaricola sp.]|uniref:N-acetylmuramoyl-L-alanine amidase n=1 Tax=Limimaricola sp. TaxID=2211665 RepID=UPI001D4C9385|nr:N-acetylmuramoyl-L-alanine amidase [Limimaricola sp.]MBI1418409.1 AMIN domain-containing protein [Limimaricola sp.]
MSGLRFLALILLLVAGAARAQDFAGLARLDVASSQVRDAGDGLVVDLGLSQPVPYRVFTMADPARLVMDFKQVDWGATTRTTLLNADHATDLRFGQVRPGLSRLVIGLSGPMLVKQAGMTVDPTTDQARIRVQMQPTTPAAFAASVGAPPDPGWDAAPPTALPPPPKAPGGPLIVMLDPGHGGIDPGAQAGGDKEADLVLKLGRDLAEAIDRAGGMKAVLTRDADVFVPLEERMTLARAAGADVMISLHADILTEDDTTGGASVYTLSPGALDAASERTAERHDRSDLLRGLDLTGQDDTVATVLMDLARQETGPESVMLADALVAGLKAAGADVNSRPRREAPLAVLKAADFPSVLVEAGFLSNPQDRAALESEKGRAAIVAGLVRGLQAYAAQMEAKAPLIRQ